MGEHFALKNNQIFVLAEAAGGVYNSDQLRTLCEVADNESAFLKITEDQRIGFMINPAKLPEIQAQVRKIGLLLKSYKAPGVPSPRACLGELCTHSHQPSLGDALELTTHLLKSFPAPKRYSSIGVNGCGRACLGSSTEDVHIVAEETGYKISIGGKISDLPQQAHLLVENVSRTDLPVVVEKILAVYYEESLDGERIHDVIERVGLTPFINALPDHLSIIPTETESGAASIDDTDTTANELEHENTAAGESSSTARASDALLDDLLESSSQEFGEFEGENRLVIGENLLDPVVPGENEKDGDLNTGLVDLEAVAVADGLIEGSNEDTAQIADGLLEEAEFEDGTLEDVERVRDAIRTELSMSPSEVIMDTHHHTDLLDEIDQEKQFSGLNERDAFSEPEPETDTFGALDAATFEHQPPTKSKQDKSKAPSREPLQLEQHLPERNPPETQQAVGVRLSIRFEGDLLAIELPSGMCFELPFEAVPQGAELSMVLPDGELKMESDGSVLTVKLGLINMRFPIPQSPQRRVA